MSVCSGFGVAISALLDDALPGPERERLEAHLVGCEVCQGEHEALSRVRAQVKALPRVGVPAHFTAQVMAAVIAEPAAAKPSTPVSTPTATATATPSASLGDVAASQGSPPGCADLAEDLSVSIDDDLMGDAAATRIREHLASCASCQAERDQLQRLRDTLQGLPRLEVPAGFLEQILSGIEAIEAETVTRLEEARQRRSVWWGRMGQIAQAAGLLFLVGAGTFLSVPEAHSVTRAVTLRNMPSAAYRVAERKVQERQNNAVSADEAAPAPALPDGPYAAVLELEPGAAFAEARAVVDQAIARYGRTEGQLQTEGFQGYVVEVPANFADDLFRELDASSAVRTARDDQEEVDRITTELDTVELKSGQVFAGQAQRRGRDVRLVVGETQLTFAAEQVVRITPASEPRRLRLELRSRD